MGIPYALHIACTYAFHGCRHMGCMWYPFTHVQLLREHAYMDTIWNPYGKRICVHTIWASYDNAIGVRLVVQTRFICTKWMLSHSEAEPTSFIVITVLVNGGVIVSSTSMVKGQGHCMDTKM